ncbi:serine/threonine-protein phosphatase 6 regulatory ankyrin repeat subunit A [Microdochium nivale]|nr:serine/threonine-protein phosphatase 6 regulatory ankyrin repeat subunit A [Microdochium nivale]
MALGVSNTPAFRLSPVPSFGSGANNDTSGANGDTTAAGSVTDDRYRRLLHLSHAWGVGFSRPPPSPLPRPEGVPSYRTPNDDITAEDLLKQQRIADSQAEQSGRSISRAFSTKKKGWEYKEIYNALVAHIASRGSPGVAEALVAKLQMVGGNLNLQQTKSRTGLLSRRKSLDLGERSQILQMAVRNCQFELVQVLLPYADALSLDTSLPSAIRAQHEAITALLVRYGAGVANTTDGQDAFRQACGVGGQAAIIGHVLSSDGRPPAPWVSQCMVEATRAGCAETVAQLSQSTADGSHDGAAALKTAVAMGRRDIALAIALGNQPPTQPGLNEAFQQLVDNQKMTPNEKRAMVEILLCMGADGEPVAALTASACENESYEMVGLLVAYGASLEYADGKAIQATVSKANLDMTRVMLGGSSRLGPARASACLGLLPKDLRLDVRHAFLALLLREGAAGDSLDEMLVDCVEAGDLESVNLLVDALSLTRENMPAQPHALPSPNHKGGLALQIALTKPNIEIAKAILANNAPSPDVLEHIMPTTQQLPAPARHDITELFLKAGLSGPAVQAALENAIMQVPPHRDEKLLALLLKAGAKESGFEDGRAINAAVMQQDVGLLRTLLEAGPPPAVTASAVLKAVAADNSGARHEMVELLLCAGAVRGGSGVSSAAASVVLKQPTDKTTLRLLLQSGMDINANEGNVVVHAVENPDLDVFKMLFDLTKPSQATLENTLQRFHRVPASDIKSKKLAILLPVLENREAIAQLLLNDLRALVKLPAKERNMEPVRTLLAHGADVNYKLGEALHIAVSAKSDQLFDLLLSVNPDTKSLAFTMPVALRIREPTERLAFTKKILDRGIPPIEVNRALVFAVKAYRDDIALIEALLAVADTRDGAALIEAVKAEQGDVVELILSQKKFSQDILNMGFSQAVTGRNRRTRSLSCSSLLKAGASGEVVSDALLAAASDGDVDLGTILVQNGGSVEHRNGQAIIAACKSGASDVLQMLLAGGREIPQEILQQCFQAATEIGDLKKREEIFRSLLELGVAGEVVHAQLISAVRYGHLGTGLVVLLLQHGASPDYNDGEAVEKATSSASLENLQLLLGLADDIGVTQKKPSSHTLVRALDAGWHLNPKTRLTVVTWIFQAGKPVPSSVHAALGRAVNEEEPDAELIRVLVNNRASPVFNECKTLIDAARKLPLPAFASLMEAKVSDDDASRAFGSPDVFGAGNVESWLTERGYGVAKLLLEHGAKGPEVNDVLAACVRARDQTSAEMVLKFMDILLQAGADVNYNNGEVLRLAALSGDADILRRLLQEKPSSETLTWAFPNVFDAKVGEDEVGELVSLFTEYSDGNHQLDVMSVPPGSLPVLYRALSQFPRSTKVLSALLDAGYYHEQMTNYQVLPGVDEEEPVTLLMWALLQPQKKIASAVLDLLIERGAKVQFETRTSHVTPLMVAISERRQDIVKSLLLAGAEVDVADIFGNSPLSMASAIGGSLAITMMSNLLAAGASKNDGSLHNAARDLNLQAMQVLVEYEHDPDFPSPIHGGRSALGELCRHAADGGPVAGAREKAMERAIEFLLKNDTDITLQIEGKTVLHLALESADPVTTTKVLLRAGMWKHINKPFNQYSDGTFTYSPTMYVQRVLPPPPAGPGAEDTKAALATLLRSNRGTDVYYAQHGPQPDDAVGMPSHIEAGEQDRRARADRHRKEAEEHALAVQRSKELAAVQQRIWADQASLEDARKKRSHAADMSAILERARVEEETFNAALRQQRMKQNVEMSHQQALTRASVTRAKEVGEVEAGISSQGQARMLAWERDMGSEKVGNASQLSSLRLREREEVEKLDKAADGRARDRIREQKKLVDSQNTLAATLGQNGGVQGGGRSGMSWGAGP